MKKTAIFILLGSLLLLLLPSSSGFAITEKSNAKGPNLASEVPYAGDLSEREVKVARIIIRKSDLLAKEYVKFVGTTAADEQAFKAVLDKLEADPVRTLGSAYQQKIADEDRTRIWKVEPGKVPSIGPDNAPVTIVVFMDFQCPFCARASNTLQSLQNEFPGKLRILFASKVLPGHAKAPLAHAAAYAAWEQGKFWEFQTLIFQNQTAMGEEQYVKYAGDLGMDVNKFKKDMDVDKYKPEFDRLNKYSEELGAKGTPTLFVNGMKIVGARPLEFYEPAIKALLAGKLPEEVVKDLK